MQRTLVDPFEVTRVGPNAEAAYRPRQRTMLDPYEVRTYRSNEPTLVDAHELPAQDPEFADWEQKTRDVCRIVVEQKPRGIGYEGWLRARSWCGEELGEYL